jgi:hypothetical protein
MRKAMLPLVVLVGLAANERASAATIVDFTGPYDVSNWTTTITDFTDGTVFLGDAPASITLLGGNQGSALVDFTVVAVEPGTVSFDWSVVGDPVDVNPFGWLRNGVFSILQNFGPGDGHAAFTVVAGDVFGFRVGTDFAPLFGPATAVITEFEVASVPEPATLLLFATAVAAITGRRRLGSRRSPSALRISRRCFLDRS